MIGSAQANNITGNGLANGLNGGTGNDTYFVNGGDTVGELAGQGTDTVLSSVSYILSNNVENRVLIGTVAIHGASNGLANVMSGNNAGNGFSGGASNDILTGLGGQDFFVFNTMLGTSNVDGITDFSTPTDTIRLDKSIFATLNLGTLATTAYKEIGDPGASVDVNDRILYNDDNGALYYDANGSAAGGGVHFSTLTNADFLVVA